MIKYSIAVLFLVFPAFGFRITVMRIQIIQRKDDANPDYQSRFYAELDYPGRMRLKQESYGTR